MVGASQALYASRDDADQRRQETLIASSCMHDHGFEFDAERQREDATRGKKREPHVYWRRS